MCYKHCCSMKITKDVPKFAAAKGVSETKAVESGMQEKARQFEPSGTELYSKAD